MTTIPRTSNSLSDLKPDTLASIEKAQRIEAGLEQNVAQVTFTESAKILGIPERVESAGTMVSRGKVVVDPANVQNARYSTKAAAELILFHYDYIPLIVAEQFNFIGQFQAECNTPGRMPLYRLVLERPLFSMGSGMMTRSLLAMPPSVVSQVFVGGYMKEVTLLREFTKAQRSAHKEQTGQDLLNQYWEIQTWELSLPDYNKFTLFLPSGIDMSFTPFARSDGIIDIVKSSPDSRIVERGFNLLTKM